MTEDINIEQEKKDFEMFKKTRREIIDKLVNNENKLKSNIKKLQIETKQFKDENNEIYNENKKLKTESMKIKLELENTKNFYEDQIKNKNDIIIKELETKYDKLVKDAISEYDNSINEIKKKLKEDKNKLLKEHENEMLKIKETNNEIKNLEKIRNKRKINKSNKVKNVKNVKSTQTNILVNDIKDKKILINRDIQTDKIKNNNVNQSIQTDIIKEVLNKELLKNTNNIPHNIVKKGSGYIKVFNKRRKFKTHPIELVEKNKISIKGILANSFRFKFISNYGTIYQREKLFINYELCRKKDYNNIVIKDEYGKSIVFKHLSKNVKLTKSYFIMHIENEKLVLNIDNKDLFNFDISCMDELNLNDINGVDSSLFLYEIKID